MKASLLINNVIIVAITKKHFTVEKAPATLFARGLAGAEVVNLEALGSGSDPDTAADAEWVQIKAGGNNKQLSANNTLLEILTPGNYRIVTEAATAGNISVGLYG